MAVNLNNLPSRKAKCGEVSNKTWVYVFLIIAGKTSFYFTFLGNGYLNREELKTILLSGLEESKLRLNDQQVDELMEVFFEEVNAKHEGYIGLEEFKNFLLKYPEVAVNLSVR